MWALHFSRFDHILHIKTQSLIHQSIFYSVKILRYRIFIFKLCVTQFTDFSVTMNTNTNCNIREGGIFETTVGR